MGDRQGGVLALVAVVCVALAAGAGYALGHSGGPDVGEAKAAGERAGQTRALADKHSYRVGYAQGRRAGYRQAYRSAYRIAVARARKAGQ